MATVLPSFDNHPLLADAELDCLLDDDWAAAELQSADLQPLAAPPPEAAPEPAPPTPVAKAAPTGSAVLIEPPAEVAGFVRTLFTLLRVCDPVVIGWSRDGKVLLVRDPARFAAEVCPKFFRHKNFNSFTRLLNMYQFRVRRDCAAPSSSVSVASMESERSRQIVSVELEPHWSASAGTSSTSAPTRRSSSATASPSPTSLL